MIGKYFQHPGTTTATEGAGTWNGSPQLVLWFAPVVLHVVAVPAGNGSTDALSRMSALSRSVFHVSEPYRTYVFESAATESRMTDGVPVMADELSILAVLVAAMPARLSRPTESHC